MDVTRRDSIESHMNKKKIFALIFMFALALVPVLSYAAGGVDDCTENSNLKCLILDFTDLIVNFLVPLIFIGVFLVFLYGVMNYIMHGGDKAKRKEGIQFMVWGIIGLTVMFSVWGLVALLKNTFDLPDVPSIQAPTIQID